MEKRRIVIKRRNVLLSILLVALAMVIMLVSFAPMNASAATNSDYANSDEVTHKYLTVSTAGRSVSFQSKPTALIMGVGGRGGTRTTVELTVVLRFDNVLDKDGNPLLVIGHVKASIPGANTTSHRVDFLGDIKVNLRLKYYEYFKKDENALSTMRIQVYHQQFTESLYTSFTYWVLIYPRKTVEKKLVHNISARVSEDKDFDDDAFEDNGGEDTNKPAVDKHWFEMFYDWLTSVFKWKLSFADFKTILIIVGIAIAGLVVFKFIRWIAK